MPMQYSEDAQSRWKELARMQGLVCFVCGEPPDLQNRGVFYDNGLCRACASQMDEEDVRRAAPPELA